MVRSADGTPIAAYDFGGSGRPLLLAHATGFHAHCWLPVVERLRDRFHCYAFDERGHGASPTPPNGRFAWELFGEDAIAVAGAFDLDRPVAAGHSAGGGLLLRGEEDQPGSWEALWLFEPVVLPPPGAEVPAANPLAGPTRKRKAWFESRRAAYDNYAGKPPFSAFTADALHAYVEHGFVDDPAGGVRLACAPDDEAATYEGAMTAGIWEGLAKVAIPVVGVAGDSSDHLPAQLLAGVIAQLPHGRTEIMHGVGHFGPFEDPDRVAASIAAALG